MSGRHRLGRHERRSGRGRGRRRRSARRGLPARRVDRPRLLPGRAAGQARARRGPGRGRQDGAGQGAREVPGPPARAPAVLRGARRGQGALRVELPQAAPAHPGGGPGHGLGRGAGRHLRRGVPARAAADDRDRLPGARRPADRRDRQDGPGVRGDAARAALGLPDLDPRARPHRGAHPSRRAAHLEQHAGAHGGAQAALPVPVARLPVDGARARDRAPARPRAARAGGRAARGDHRDGARDRPQEAALDRGVDRLGARAPAARRGGHLTGRLPLDPVDHRQAPHGPRHGRRARGRAARGRLDVTGGFPAGVVAFAENLRAEGLAIGTSELLDAFEALGEVSWTDEGIFREALGATLAKSPDDRRVFDLVFERFFFRAAEEAALREGVREGGSAEPGGEDEDGITGGEQIDYDNLREQLLQAIRDGDESAMRDLARLAIAAFGRRGDGSGVLGVDVQRIRRALGLRSDPGGPPPRDPDAPPAPALTRDQIRRFEQHLRRELERAQIERTQTLPPSRPLNELDRALPSGPLQDLAAVHRVVAQLKRRLATQGHELKGRKRRAHVDVRRTMRASLNTGGVPVELKFRPTRPRRPEIFVLCDVSTSVTSASVFFLSVLHALHDAFRKMRSFVFIERVSEVTEVFARERDFSAVAKAISKDAGVADVSGYTDYGRVWREFLAQVADDLHRRATVIVLGDARTNGRDPRADVFASIAALAGRTFWLNPEPRLYWNYGDSVISAYEQHCEAHECWTTRQLEDFVKALTRPYA